MPPTTLRLLVLAAACAAAPLPLQAQAAKVTAADVHFMQGMIGHHAQAVVMSHLVPSRTTTASIRLLSERIDVAQQQEITQMQRWLEAHGAVVPAADGAMHDHQIMGEHPMLMPGMLTPAQLDQLTAAHGAEFDRLFLTFMIQHHEGALTMVATLFSTQGSGHEPALYEFASDVDAGQRAEIARMRALLQAPAR
jgi:uncharacterized protein (DUF305 family)